MFNRPYSRSQTGSRAPSGAWRALSLQEKQVAALICQGWESDEQIAVRIGATPSAVRDRTSHILVKLGLKGEGDQRAALRAALAGVDLGPWQ